MHRIPIDEIPNRIQLTNALLEKVQFEQMMTAAPDDAHLRSQYFNKLQAVSKSLIGMSWMKIPDISYPVYFRCGTQMSTI